MARRSKALAALKGEIVNAPPLPRVRDGYVQDLPPEYAERYIDFFGDLNPFHEAALIRTVLSRLLEIVQKEFIDTQADPEERDLTDGKIRKLLSVINAINKASEVVARSHDQIVGKKVVLTFPSERITEEVRRQCDRFVNELLDWLPACLCLECRTRFTEELMNRQRTTLFEEARE